MVGWRVMTVLGAKGPFLDNDRWHGMQERVF